MGDVCEGTFISIPKELVLYIFHSVLMEQMLRLNGYQDEVCSKVWEIFKCLKNIQIS